jgi:uncharacterized protein YjdB
LAADKTVTYGGSKYKRVYLTQYTPIYTTWTPSAANSEQDNNGYFTNIVYWFKYEPIQWRVLSNTSGELFVMAEKLLDAKAYNQTQTTVTWENCTLRTWLNSTFYNAAFSATEKAQIMTSYVVNEDDPWSGREGGNDTNDKLFELSYSEVMNPAYGFPAHTGYDTGLHYIVRSAKGTDYAKSQGEHVFFDLEVQFHGESHWWLRSPGSSFDGDGIIHTGGRIYGDGDNYCSNVSIRPAFRINSSSKILVSSVTLNASSLTLAVGEGATLTAVVSPSIASNKTVSWKSSNAAVATVDSAGKAMAKASGTATITCTAKDGSGKLATCVITVVPPTPVNLKAVKASSTSVRLTWTGVSGVTGYYIYRAIGTGAYTKIKTLASASYIDASLAKSKTYHYKVQAYKLIGSTLYVSDSSSIGTATL